ncbi:hypothetical protein Thiosp_02086 [Thiorhodovibrio litoralis]|nr:hypothetical protein Thiosp_02086 [Thiorhodovibrio litoralis]
MFMATVTGVAPDIVVDVTGLARGLMISVAQEETVVIDGGGCPCLL